jgi:hypothetical protein
MKKAICGLIAFLCLISAVYAIPSGFLPVGVGAKYAGMGGAGAAIVDDISCAYFNPAGIVKTRGFGLELGGGAATEGLSDLNTLWGNVNDPAKFLSSNFDKNVDINGGVNLIMGLNVSKIGLSVIPAASLQLRKTAGTIIGSYLLGNVVYDSALTLGYGFGLPGLPVSLDIGANLKSINYLTAQSIVNNATSSSDYTYNQSGIGFDLGAKAGIDTPIVPINCAIVMKDLGATLKGKRTAINTTYDTIGNIISQNKTETDMADYTIPTTLVIAAATKIPVVGILAALDIDSVSGGDITPYTLTHLGFEYPILGLFAIRAGLVSGGVNGNISQTTFGAGLNMGVNANIAFVADSKNSKNNQTVVDVGFGF